MCCKIFSLAAAVAAIAVASSAYASEWNYGCKGALPVFDDGEAIFFNRESLVLLPRSWLKGTLRDFVVRDPTSDVVAIAKARDENSGLVQTMLFTLLDHPDQKLTLTETSSKTISDIRENLVSPRTRSAARALLHAGNNGEKNKTRPELGFGCDKVKNPFVSDVEMGSVLDSMRSEAGQIFAAGFLNRILTSVSALPQTPASTVTERD